jgi:hypothetical protein
MTASRTPSKAELSLKVSPTSLALTDASVRTLSGRLDRIQFVFLGQQQTRQQAASKSLKFLTSSHISSFLQYKKSHSS